MTVRSRSFLSGPVEEFGDGMMDPFDLAGFELRVHREGQALARELFGDREVTDPVAKRSVRLLKMDRDWIVHTCLNMLSGQVTAKLVSLVSLDDVKVENVGRVWTDSWDDHVQVSEKRRVNCRG